MTEREEKFTPGPWTVYADTPSTDQGWHVVTTANRLRVLANVHIEEGNAMDRANARLIAAAPELYEALKHLYEQIGGLCERGKIIESDLAGGFDEDLEEAVAAIAKARGEA